MHFTSRQRDEDASETDRWKDPEADSGGGQKSRVIFRRDNHSAHNHPHNDHGDTHAEGVGQGDHGMHGSRGYAEVFGSHGTHDGIGIGGGK